MGWSIRFVLRPAYCSLLFFRRMERGSVLFRSGRISPVRLIGARSLAGRIGGKSQGLIGGARAPSYGQRSALHRWGASPVDEIKTASFQAILSILPIHVRFSFFSTSSLNLHVLNKPRKPLTQGHFQRWLGLNRDVTMSGDIDSDVPQYCCYVKNA